MRKRPVGSSAKTLPPTAQHSEPRMSLDPHLVSSKSLVSVVNLDGLSSNQISELFDELARWEHVLKTTSMGMKPPSP